MVKTRLIPGHEDKEDGQGTPLEPGSSAAIVQPLTGARWRDGDMPDGLDRMVARPKAILIAWGRPWVSWRKGIKFE
jgi:hypothetical protein